MLNNGISTDTAHHGERFTLTVRQPYQFEGATIEGYVSNVQRSGRVTGRSQMTLNSTQSASEMAAHIGSRASWKACGLRREKLCE